MTKIRSIVLGVAAAAVAVPASAGEVTGAGDETGMWGHARSECAFSGLNDNDGDPRDPGGYTQSYGQNVRLTPLDPSQLDPNADFFQPIPGYACNPNRGREGPFYPEE